ncbi:MAG: hypothetical protein H0U99_07585 [Chthoniobacterales bacterium]|nr:hypothetical protein [Chthoniobacterales bacterium]
MRGVSSRYVLVLLPLAAVFPAQIVPAKTLPQQEERAGRFVGSAGCKSSSCHGGAGPNRDQFITWTQRDFHARSYAVLLNARSARIAETLGAGSAAASARCTICHSPFASVASARLKATAHPDEGVSCESCHGAGENWWRGHTRPDWSHAIQIAAGMRELHNFYARANACVACHQNIENALLKAGHPELRFELDGQTVSEPRHWRDEGQWNGVRAWLTGQAVALRESSWAVSTEADSGQAGGDRSNALAWLLAKTTEATPLPRITWPSADPATLLAQADGLARAAATSDWTQTSVEQLRVHLAATQAEFVQKGSEATGGLARRAERLVLALDRLTVALGDDHSTHANAATALGRLREDVKSFERFDERGFAGHLQDFRYAITLVSR